MAIVRENLVREKSFRPIVNFSFEATPMFSGTVVAYNSLHCIASLFFVRLVYCSVADLGEGQGGRPPPPGSESGPKWAPLGPLE